jgi:hypothetical protein
MESRLLKVLIFLLIFILLAGCSSPAATSTTPAATITPAAAETAVVQTTAVIPADTAIPATPTPAGLTAEMVKNAQYTLNAASSPATIQLKDGVYESGSGADYVSVHMADPMAFADLNADGLPDAVAVVAENYGGSGVFYYLVVYLNQGGQPQYYAARPIDDRAKINALTILKRQILLDALIHGTNDGMCCPTFPVQRIYQLSKSGLDWLRQTSKTPDGKDRVITITSPADGDQVSDSIQVKGTVSVAPFENNLTYKIYDATGKELVSGPFSVTSNGLGGPGVFNNPIDLSAIPPGLLIRFELTDVSAADGSILAMDSVDLLIK